MKNIILNKVKYEISSFLNTFGDYIFQNVFIIIYLYILRKYTRNLVSEEKYILIKPLLKTKYIKYKTDYISDIFNLTDDEIIYYKNILDTIPVYEKLTIASFIETIYNIDIYPLEKNDAIIYFGFDIGRYVMYKPLLGKPKFHKIVDVGDDFKFVLENGKTKKLFFINFLFYTPISISNKRKILIKKLSKNI